MAITTKSSINVKARREPVRRAKNGVPFQGLETSAKRVGTRLARRVPGGVPRCFGPKHHLGYPSGRLLACESSSPRTPSHEPELAVARVQEPLRLQRRSRAGFSPASCPASRRTPEGSINDSSRTQTKMSILTGTPVPRRACSPSMQVGLRTAVQGCRAFSSVGSSLDPSNNGKRGVTPVNARLPRRGRSGFTPDSLFAGLGRLPNPATSTL
jgi:hypothetical protein